MDGMQILEIVGVLTGITCVYLQTKEIIWSWPAGILSVTIYVYIFFTQKLYSDTILHFVYIALNIYGWWIWSKHGPGQTKKSIDQLSFSKSLLLIPVILLLSAAWGGIMDRTTDAAFPYFDAFTTVGSLIAQVLLAKKIIQNWILWIVVDLVAIGVYTQKELYYTSFLFFVYLILCISGYMSWTKSLKSQQSETPFSV